MGDGRCTGSPAPGSRTSRPVRVVEGQADGFEPVVGVPDRCQPAPIELQLRLAELIVVEPDHVGDPLLVGLDDQAGAQVGIVVPAVDQYQAQVLAAHGDEVELLPIVAGLGMRCQHDIEEAACRARVGDAEP